jgi:hypothetical protein
MGSEDTYQHLQCAWGDQEELDLRTAGRLRLRIEFWGRRTGRKIREAVIGMWALYIDTIVTERKEIKIVIFKLPGAISAYTSEYSTGRYQ